MLSHTGVAMAEDKRYSVPAYFSFSEHFAGLTTFAESIAGLLKPVNEAMNEFVRVHHERWSAMLQALARDFDRSYPQLESASDRLADLGWTIPMLLTPRTFVELADPAYSDTDIEKMLLALYTDGDYKELRAVQKDILAAPLLAPWRGLLDEAFEVFWAGHLQIVVPALLMVIEGAVTSESGNLGAANVRVLAMAAHTKSQQEPQSWDALVWRSLTHWLDKLFAYHTFTGPRPPTLNRHWILHGRDAGPWEKTDVVRLFAALHALVS